MSISTEHNKRRQGGFVGSSWCREISEDNKALPLNSRTGTMQSRRLQPVPLANFLPAESDTSLGSRSWLVDQRRGNGTPGLSKVTRGGSSAVFQSRNSSGKLQICLDALNFTFCGEASGLVATCRSQPKNIPWGLSVSRDAQRNRMLGWIGDSVLNMQMRMRR